MNTTLVSVPSLLFIPNKRAPQQRSSKSLFFHRQSSQGHSARRLQLMRSVRMSGSNDGQSLPRKDAAAPSGGVLLGKEGPDDSPELDRVSDGDSSTPSTPLAPPPGWMMKTNKATKYAVSAAAFGALLYHQDLNVCWGISGSVLNSVFCKILKRLLNVSRPDTGLHGKKDPGMPSSHAQSLSYLATYPLATWLLTPVPLDAVHAAASLLLGSGAIFLAWLRVACGFHTTAQVVVGFTFGTLTAIFWRHFGLNVFPIIQSDPTLMMIVNVATVFLLGVFFFIAFKGKKVLKKLMKKD